MKTGLLKVAAATVGMLSSVYLSCAAADKTPPAPEPEKTVSAVKSLDDIIAARRTVREFATDQLDRETALKLLWAGYGVTDKESGKRSVPSAYAKYYLTLLYCDASGTYEYAPEKNEMVMSSADDIRPALSAASFEQPQVKDNGAVIVIAGDMNAARNAFKDNAEKFIYLEAGHSAQNILLEATYLGLGTGPIGGYDPAEVNRLLQLDEGMDTIYLLVIGNKK